MPYAGTLQNVGVTASGLGSVDFFPSNKNVPNQVTLEDLHPEGATVNFCVHGELIREPASSVQGKLIAFAPGYKPTAFSVKVDRPALTPWIKALEWFFADLIASSARRNIWCRQHLGHEYHCAAPGTESPFSQVQGRKMG